MSILVIVKVCWWSGHIDPSNYADYGAYDKYYMLNTCLFVSILRSTPNRISRLD